jgi:hypothetical protein
MFSRFQSQRRFADGSAFTADAETVCAKLLASTGQMSFQAMLAEICEFIARFSPDYAQRYLDFWLPLLSTRKAA